MRKSGVYKITNIKNGKFYIGSSIDINTRWRRHKSDLRNENHPNLYLQRAWNKYGERYFIFELCLETNDLRAVEQKLLDGYFGSADCYNLNPNVSGGDLLTNHPYRDDIIRRISETTISNRASMSKEERVKKWGKNGKDNPNYGNGWTEEQRRQASDRMKKRMSNPEERQKISKAMEKRMSNPEERQKISEFAKTRIGDKNPFYGKRHSDETKQKLRETHLGKYNGNQEKSVEINKMTYKSVSFAARQLGVCPATIIYRIKSKNIKFNNYRYKED